MCVCVCVCVCVLKVLLLYIHILVQINKVFAYGLGDQGSITDRVIPNTQKMVLDAPLFSTQHY